MATSVSVQLENGGPAPERVTEAIAARAKVIARFARSSSARRSPVGDEPPWPDSVQVVDPVGDYAELMESLFDFDALRELLSGEGFGCASRDARRHRAVRDRDLERRLARPSGTVMNGAPLTDFGGGHRPESDVRARVVALMNGPDAPISARLGRRRGPQPILGAHFFVTRRTAWPFGANATLAPVRTRAGGSRAGRCRRAKPRSSRTRARDAFARNATGLKFFGNLLDAGRSAPVGKRASGPDPTRPGKKTGSGRAFFWLNILARHQRSVEDVVREHWVRFGRNYYTRHATRRYRRTRQNDVFERVRKNLITLPCATVGGFRVAAADSTATATPSTGGTSDGRDAASARRRWTHHLSSLRDGN